MLALDPPGDPTIGACLAADLSGPRRHRYGAMRDLVIGVTVVLPGGLVASSGGKVVKNVAGYDLGKLFSGSRGRLGLIARVALRLHPRPAAAATVVAEEPDARVVWQELTRSQLEPSAVDVLPGRVAMLFEGLPAAVAAQVAAAPGEPPTTRSGRRARAARRRAAARRAVRLAGLPRSPGPGPGIAYVAAAEPRPWSPLAERVRAGFDPGGHPRLMDASLIDDCVHCGFCLPTCPTWELWHEEMDTPARPHLADEGDARGNGGAQPDGGRALRPLPRLHGLPHLVPVRRQVRPADRARAREGRAGGASGRSTSALLRALVFSRVPASAPPPGRAAPLGAAGARAAPAVEGSRAEVAGGRRAAARSRRRRARSSRASACSPAVSSPSSSAR